MIKYQSKANTVHVLSELGGGGNGHLGLVLTDIDYTCQSWRAQNCSG